MTGEEFRRFVDGEIDWFDLAREIVYPIETEAERQSRESIFVQATKACKEDRNA